MTSLRLVQSPSRLEALCGKAYAQYGLDPLPSSHTKAGVTGAWSQAQADDVVLSYVCTGPAGGRNRSRSLATTRV